jgi:hypothetical protein
VLSLNGACPPGWDDGDCGQAGSWVVDCCADSAAGPRPRQEATTVDVEDRVVAMVALKDTTRIPPSALVARVKSMFPWLEQTVGEPVRQGDNDCLIPLIVQVKEATIGHE